MIGLNFNGKHSYSDFGLIMNSKTISTPSKKKLKDSVVGMNSVYDFSNLASGGEIIYNQRDITVTFTLICSSKQVLLSKLNKVMLWLEETSQSQLIFDDMKDYYYMAEFEDVTQISEEQECGEFTIKFTAEPFKSSVNLVNSDLFDTFNFEEDVVQSMSYTVSNSATVSVYNFGRLIVPTINCTSAMTVNVDGVVYNLVTGDNTLYKLKLKNGYNSIIVTGTGTILFKFRKVVI